ncbi:hypothetical protein CASFOL_001851 [Castilleja foliolosa]|uniref:Transposase n=1 Tax=Castilleja foliolosa TaxID=1961234 RepID=A0ABD3ECK9_9LAMI
MWIGFIVLVIKTLIDRKGKEVLKIHQLRGWRLSSLVTLYRSMRRVAQLSLSTMENLRPILNCRKKRQLEEVDKSMAIQNVDVEEIVVKTGRSEVYKDGHAKKVKRRKKDGSEFEVAICTYCQKDVPAGNSKNGTSSIRHHLFKCCQKSPLYAKVEKNQSVLTSDSMGAGLVSHTFNQKRLELMVVKFVIKDEQPFKVVEGSGYVAMMKEAQPRFKVPCRKKVAAGVWDLYVIEKAQLLQSVNHQRVSITTDTWTSIQNINYMVVTAHFLDEEWKLQKRIINFIKITSHKGDDIGKVLEVCLNQWGIENIFSITVDNASANDVAIEYMKKRLKEMNSLLVHGKYLHMRCACHILNLVVKSGLKELTKSVEGIRNCVKYIHSSPSRLDKFRDFAILFKMDKMSNVPLDVSTRWNATYKMLDVAYKYRKVFYRMAEENIQFHDYFEEMEMDSRKYLTKRVGPPNEDDWEKSLAFTHFLKKFYDATLTLSATKKVTSTVLWDQIISLRIEIEKKVHDDSNPTLKSVAITMMRKFNKYWGSLESVNPLVFLGQVLNPCYKLQMITINLKALGWDDMKVDGMCKVIKGCLLDLYNEYRKSYSTTIGSTTEEVELNEDFLIRACGGDENKVEMMRKLIQERRDQSLSEITNEVDKYFAAPYISLIVGDFDLCSWWKSNTKEFPILSHIAKDILAIPSSTVASENAFSLGRRVVDPFRASLTPKMVEALVCASDWLRAEDINLYKEPTEDMIKFYKEMEEMEIGGGDQSSQNN